MCGIAGIAGRNAKQYQQQLKQMTDAIRHRGPDGVGIAVFDNCVLGHRRLSIIDLNTGDQPMHSALGSSIIFNGEFYGYLDIKKTLDWKWRTTSDTEVILALYHQYGSEEFVNKIRGMFAFALWDKKEESLIAARDRFGEKPFYYALTKNNEIVFASEIKAILASGLVQPEINPESLSHYLQHLYVHPHHSIYKNIFVLPPAHFLLFKNGMLKTECYWKLPEQQLKISKPEAIKECYRLLNKAVKKQLVADVPVGCFLSGGLDSSTITALASQNSNQQLTTISFSFGQNNSELPYSRKVAEKYKTNNIELHQDDFDIARWFEKMIAVYDEPFADSSNIPTYLISQMAAKQFKVVITGDGGDELMAGYRNWYQPLYQMQHPDGITGLLKNLRKKILHSKYRSKGIAETHLEQNKYFQDKELKQVCNFNTGYSFNKFLWQPNNTVEAALRMDLQDYMPGDILVKTDRAAMANSLELRAPFLDIDFAEFCIALPENFKISNQDDKIIMRESFGHLWPGEIMKRHKQGFGAPVHEWLMQNEMKQLKYDYLANKGSKIYDWLDFRAVSQFASKNNYQTWILLTLAVWMEKKL
jgi:asparagine synthase (glutamine-hydrolysing)